MSFVGPATSLIPWSAPDYNPKEDWEGPSFATNDCAMNRQGDFTDPTFGQPSFLVEAPSEHPKETDHEVSRVAAQVLDFVDRQQGKTKIDRLLAANVKLFAQMSAILTDKETAKCVMVQKPYDVRILHHSEPLFNLSWQFQAYPYLTIQNRLAQAGLQPYLIDDKVLVTVDGLFLESEGEELRKFFKEEQPTIPFASQPDSIAKGEKPPKRFPTDRLFELFENPMPSLDLVHKFFSYIGFKLKMDVSTHPRLWVEFPIPFANNYLTEANAITEREGWHADYQTAAGLLFDLSKKCAPGYYSRQFLNGKDDQPFLLSILLYTTSENFDPEFGMGTVFGDKKDPLKIACKHMRLVIFEGDIMHATQQSYLPEGVTAWRNSFVWRIVFRPPTPEKVCIKDLFLDFLKAQVHAKPLISVVSAAKEKKETKTNLL